MHSALYSVRCAAGEEEGEPNTPAATHLVPSKRDFSFPTNTKTHTRTYVHTYLHARCGCRRSNLLRWQAKEAGLFPGVLAVQNERC